MNPWFESLGKVVLEFVFLDEQYGARVEHHRGKSVGRCCTAASHEYHEVFVCRATFGFAVAVLVVVDGMALEEV